MPLSNKRLLLFLGLMSAFVVYNAILYTSEKNYYEVKLSEKGIAGENIWLKNNCNSCHQIYGLGGYLGPDLTNVYSKKHAGESYIKAIVNSGIRSMPKFNFSETEKDNLVQFLKEIDQTGYYPNTEVKIGKDGWLDVKNKQNSAKE